MSRRERSRSCSLRKRVRPVGFKPHAWKHIEVNARLPCRSPRAIGLGMPTSQRHHHDNLTMKKEVDELRNRASTHGLERFGVRGKLEQACQKTVKLDLAAGPTLSALLNPAKPRPAGGQPWLQVLSHDSTAYDLAYAFSEVFEEAMLCRALHRQSFCARMCRAGLGSVGGALRVQLASLRSCQRGQPPNIQQRQILLEASRRRAMCTVQGSWKPTRSAIYAWAEFCEAFHFAHFPIQPETARMFSAFICHGPTLSKYLQHLAMGPYVPRARKHLVARRATTSDARSMQVDSLCAYVAPDLKIGCCAGHGPRCRGAWRRRGCRRVRRSPWVSLQSAIANVALERQASFASDPPSR